MPYSDADLWPDSWRREAEPRFRLSLAVIAVLLVVAPLGVAALLYSEQNDGGARYAVAVAVLGALILWIGVESRLRLRRNGTEPITEADINGHRGLKIPYSRRIHILITVLMSAFALIFVMAAVDSADDGSYFWGALAVLFGSFPILLLRGKYALGYVLVTSEGVLHRGWTFRSFLPWSGIDMIHPMQTDGPDILITARDETPWEPVQLTRLWRADKPVEIPSDDGRGRKPAIHIPGKYLAADPAIVLAVLVYYGKHPEARTELASGAALRRVQSAAFSG
ncbi:hypothetical protein [Haloechinothrix salitolerans]|uniref:PH domain-containing protein n=1 Tax=Haloechinothrix salitolerans TaxID=926830 RepID=A0ABW2BYI1_9PSEU